ncbi:hypothetical protein C9374_004057 [Naegleria lovaniensis]|uniref:Uncharacterized protein n=1 Tax=Naegleria lovaniensis TaxID=51637 RepID=A0AA88GSF1_NAELO|nr:uncharacterized protein C9374_004057 [Naegleria lovaniensis]KAG2385413.1 hypothetical protein C9374_004057 [Naegleria lovaniensis]
MKEFSTHVRAYNTRCILNEQEILEFISDKRDFPDELDPNILSKASDKDVKWYVTTLGEKTVNMLCEWKHRLNYLESECKDVQDFSEMKQKIEHNIKQMKETLGSVSSVTAAEHFLEMDSDIKLLQDEESKPSPPIPLRKGRSKSLISNFSSSSKPRISNMYHKNPLGLSSNCRSLSMQSLSKQQKSRQDERARPGCNFRGV